MSCQELYLRLNKIESWPAQAESKTNRDSTLGARFAPGTPVSWVNRDVTCRELPAIEDKYLLLGKGEVMAKRMFLMLGVTAVLLTALGFVKFKQVQSAVQAASFQPPPEAVKVLATQRKTHREVMDVSSESA